MKDEIARQALHGCHWRAHATYINRYYRSFRKHVRTMALSVLLGLLTGNKQVNSQSSVLERVRTHARRYSPAPISLQVNGTPVSCFY